MEVGFGRGVGRKGNGMMRERMKTEEKMRWNTMTLEFESRPCNESFARVSAAAFLAQLNPTGGGSGGCQDGDFGGGYECDDSRIPAGKRENSDEVCAGSGGEGVSGDGKRYRRRDRKCGEGDGADVYDLPGAGAVGDGVFVMEAFMDELEVRSHPGWGTEVVMKRKIGVHPEM